MNKRDIDKLVRWAVDSDLEKFGEIGESVMGLRQMGIVNIAIDI